MFGISNLIQNKALAWARHERENAASAVGSIFRHIDEFGKLRGPQISAIEVYLWLKFAGGGRRLADLVINGELADDELAKQHNCRNPERWTPSQQFLLCFAGENNLPALAGNIRENPDPAEMWDKAVRDLLRDFSYPNYFFSLPMGAGKTYLMASFICLDLHFSRIIGGDSFAQNFAVFAPHAAKTAILPALRTIKEFKPEWILPDSAAKEVRREMRVEILDKPASNKKNLRTNNPNLQKVNRLSQPDSRGLVFITNAEKVVLEKYSDSDSYYQNMGAKEKDEVKKTNELRDALAQIPALGVMLDEGVHAYSDTGKDDKKLRDAVRVFQGGGNLRYVLGFSGTPYVKSSIQLGGAKIKLNRLQDVVYDFPLAKGLGVFLKTPKIHQNDGVREADFISDSLAQFFAHYDKEYTGGAKSKIAFYCPSIAALNQKILPAVKGWFSANRPGKEDEIFSYYTEKSKEYSLPKTALADFHRLDESHSPHRVVLLVAVGKEGWDCKSLTAVALPRKTTTANFVLQTSCRCLREVDDAKNESAMICLGEGNYEILKKELLRKHHLTIQEFQQSAENEVTVAVRKPKLGKLRYKQVHRRVKIVARRTVGDANARLGKFKFAEFQKRHPYDIIKQEGVITSAGKLRAIRQRKEKSCHSPDGEFPLSSPWRFAAELSRACYGALSAAELEMKHGESLAKIHAELNRNKKWFASHRQEDIWLEAVREIAALFADEDEHHSEWAVGEETEIELLEWRIPNPTIPHHNLMLPEISQSQIKRYRKHPERIGEDVDDDLDPADISFNYAPYRFDSALEKNALIAVLREAAAQKFEFYYNGITRGDLASFYIETPQGVYTPDFLLIKRNGKSYCKQADNQPDSAVGKIARLLIVETKGDIYYGDNFRAKEKFVKGAFRRHNPHIRYHCIVDRDGKNDISAHLGDFRRVVRRWAGISE